MQKGYTLNVHDHGCVRYIDHMGTDMDIVEAARVSYRGGSKGIEQDLKLLGYLFREKHTSPFEMVKVKFNIKMPIFVCRQFIRHRMQNFNEVSGRYSVLPEEYYLPQFLRRQDTKNKQGSVEAEDLNHTELQSEIATAYRFCHKTYELLLKKGVAREQARIVLPVGIYTEFYSCWDLNNLIKYLFLREDGHAQSEHRDYANAMKDIARMLFPATFDLYDSFINRRSILAKTIRDAMLKKIADVEGNQVSVEDGVLTEDEIFAILAL
jgi:thymidylate synthase (FAD)